MLAIAVAAAGYVNPFHPIDENADHRRFNDGVLHWQRRPRVYPFGEQPKQVFVVLFVYIRLRLHFLPRTREPCAYQEKLQPNRQARLDFSS